MSNVENAVIAREFLTAIAAGDQAAFERVISPNWVNHDPSLPPFSGLAGVQQLSGIFRTAFPDIKMVFEDMLADGDKVAGRFVLTGTNTGSLMGMPPSGKSVNVTATGILQIQGGKVTETWVNLDTLGLMQQVGAIPAHG